MLAPDATEPNGVAARAREVVAEAKGHTADGVVAGGHATPPARVVPELGPFESVRGGAL